MDVLLKAFRKYEIKTMCEYLNRMNLICELDIWYKIFISQEMKVTQKLR